MDKDNMIYYKQFEKTPAEARKTIGAGRLKGFTDINPMWRIKRLTEVYGPCGIGWKYVITDKIILDGADGEKKAFVDIELYYRENGEWSAPIPGTGGSSFVSKEKGGLYTDDECFKKALTDAIGVACKALGMSADIYFQADRTKYINTPDNAEQPTQSVTEPPTANSGDFVPLCTECGARLSIAEHEYSVKRFNKPLCRPCQRKQQ